MAIYQETLPADTSTASYSGINTKFSGRETKIPSKEKSNYPSTIAWDQGPVERCLAQWKASQRDRYLPCPDESFQPHLPHPQGPGLLEPHGEPKGWGGTTSNRAADCFQDLKPGDFKASDSDISNATYGFVFPKYCDKDFNFILCQESSGAKNLSSTEDSYMNPQKSNSKSSNQSHHLLGQNFD